MRQRKGAARPKLGCRVKTVSKVGFCNEEACLLRDGGRRRRSSIELEFCEWMNVGLVHAGMWDNVVGTQLHFYETSGSNGFSGTIDQFPKLGA